MKNIFQEDDHNPAIQEIKAAMKATKDKRMFERYQAILLHLKGMTYEQIASIVGRTSVTIRSYVRAYKAKGLTGLSLGHSPGRPHQLTEDQEMELSQLIIEKKPADVGFPAEMNWTSFLVRDWIKREFGVSYTDRGVRKLLHRLGLSYTKPTYTLTKADPQKQEEFKREFETLKKTD